MNTIKLLFVEDDECFAFVVKSCLEDVIGGYEVRVACNGMEGLKLYRDLKPDVVIADIEMPVMDGMEMVRHIREKDDDTVICFATGDILPKQIEKGFGVGANSYIKKPFMPQELDGYVKGLLRVKERYMTNKAIYTIGKYTLDVVRSCLTNTVTGQEEKLTFLENQILKILVVNKNNVVERGTILMKVWNKGVDDYYASRSLDVFIAKIRKAMKTDSHISLKTIRKVGFMLEVKE